MKTIPHLPLVLLFALTVSGQNAAPGITGFALTNGRPVIRYAPVPSAAEYQARQSASPITPGGVVPGNAAGGVWTGANIPTEPAGFYRIEATQLTTPQVVVPNLLGRIAYGPTPDELERVRSIGPAAYIAEQLAPETIAEELDVQAPPEPQWRRVTATGTGTASQLYIYLDGPGDAYIDDIRLVAGTTDTGVQANLLGNGDFERALSTNDWVLTPNVAVSARSQDYVHGGSASFHLVSATSGSTSTDSLVQTIRPSLNPAQNYTLSFWYLTSTANRRLTVRLSGRGIDTTTALDGSAVESPASAYSRLIAGTASIDTLRAWHLLHAVRSRRQLTEVFRQFLENHFVTEYSKSFDYFANAGGLQGEFVGWEATRQEFQENRRWRDAFLNPRCTFLDLLRISAESPAMIIYLDTVLSRGDFSTSARTNRIANENYARELCELFCFGVDNGYDQGDIVQISRAWTGWSVELLPTNQLSNPFASRSTQYVNASLTNATERNRPTNIIGNWAFKYRAERHDPRVKWIFYDKDASGNILTGSPKRVPARYGPPWAGRTYGLRLENGSTTNGIQDGYRIIAHMADQPFTQEYISVKLCRLLVHDGFQHGYDFTDGVSTPEEDLVKACMSVWENPPGSGPKGQIRHVLRVILNSDLFQAHLTAAAKVKTPLEFAASALRVLRAARGDGTFTSATDAAAVVGSNGPLNRAGRMRLFDRAEPDGYPEDGAGWVSAGTLGERLRWVQSLCIAGAGLPTTPAARSPADNVGGCRVDPSGLLALKLGNGNRSAEAVVDYLLDLLFPSEGRANLQQYRAISIGFLNTADNGTTASPFANLVPGTRDYDGRVRGLAALLLSTPRFQEQ